MINAMTKDKNEEWAWTKTLGVWSLKQAHGMKFRKKV